MKILATNSAIDRYKQFSNIQDMIRSITKGVKFPCICYHTNDYGDKGEPIVLLPNGNEISTRYLQIAD